MKEITPLRQKIKACVTVPGSKSITQRALIAAALADGQSLLRGPLASEDTDYTATALTAMGVEIDRDGDTWRVVGTGGCPQAPTADIFLGNNGTATRFLTAVAALGSGNFRITGEKRMGERPIGPLLDALRGWGAEIRCLENPGCPPLEVIATGLAGGDTRLPEGKSSQYLSALLLVAPYARKTAVLEVTPPILSRPYVAMTIAVMRAFGVEVDAARDFSLFSIRGQQYQPRAYAIEGDASAASYFWAAAATSESRVTVAGVPARSLQGDAVFVDYLERMGCHVERAPEGITVEGPERLVGIDVDMGDCPDLVPALAVVAAQAWGCTRISNIAHLRIKECDRLHVMATELKKIGVELEENDDALVIAGRKVGDRLAGDFINTHNDHRIAMSFAIAGLTIPGMGIKNPACVAKSFPDFWERFTRTFGGH